MSNEIFSQEISQAKNETLASVEMVKTCAGLLAGNIDHVMKEHNDTQGMSNFSREGNMILFIILPRYHGGNVIYPSHNVNSALEEYTLLKIMYIQSQALIDYVRHNLKDPRFADWISGCLLGFLKKCANKYSSRHTVRISDVKNPGDNNV